MCGFIVLSCVFHTKPRDWLEERLGNDLFCVERDIKPQVNQCWQCRQCRFGFDYWFGLPWYLWLGVVEVSTA